MRRVSGGTSSVNRVAGAKIAELKSLVDGQKKAVLAMRSQRDEAAGLLSALASGRTLGALAVALSAGPGAPFRSVRLEDSALHGELSGIADAATADVLLVPAQDGGLYAVDPGAGGVATFVMSLAAGCLLGMLQRVLFGDLSDFLKGLGGHLTDMRPVEAMTLVPLGVLVVVFGLWPGLILDLIAGSVDSALAAVSQAAPVALGLWR